MYHDEISGKYTVEQAIQYTVSSVKTMEVFLESVGILAKEYSQTMVAYWLDLVKQLKLLIFDCD